MALEYKRQASEAAERFVPRDDNSSNRSSNKSDGQGSDNRGGSDSGKKDSSHDNSSPNGNGKGGFGFSGMPPPPPCFGLCVKDNDARLVYQGSWILENDFLGVTTHRTTTPGSSVSFKFNGSGIVVFGHVPESNETHPPPTISYTVDGSGPFSRTEPQAAKMIRSQPLFAIDNLSNEEHNFDLNVTEATAPFILDRFFLFQPNSGLQKVAPSAGIPSSKPGASSVTSPQNLPNSAVSDTALKAVSATLGSLIIVLLCIIAYLVLLLHKGRRRPYVDLESSHRRSLKSNTIFTSSDTIMRHHPTSVVWSDYSRSVAGPHSSLALPALHLSPSATDSRSQGNVPD